MKNPTTPDNPSQNQLAEVASVGKNEFPVSTRVIPKSITARKRRIRLTESEPTVRPAFSK